ncbi:RagB/SusD family nutrient uptake outer membrane protein [Dyadobacter sp. CY312]|uniref:RagB/SusD family nutrient uptake outer membrane protein n=1 Tax=Dyadobacter sp. CY312 TaxID=2907303 RepID=UPI001F231676|nr:RagB/SusD family nutrient uptake outer membrane protein [Dyadobacter sp. CY312]MCE7040561.1 RagB/SusD family nutrient uptake outer membrane protein [Dyadobacter sp. CY312]
MKKNMRIYAILLTSFLFATSSCNNRLDVNPTQSIDENDALSTSKDVEVTLIGCYDGLQDEDVYGGGFQVAAELLGNNGELGFGGTFQNLLEMFNKEMTTVNVSALTTWRDSYVAINRCNNVLSALEIVDESKRERIEGEARFIRGSIYFDLVRLYAKTWGDGNNASNLGVPLVLTPTRGVSDEDKIARNSVAEVYAQVLEDLNAAKELLPETNTFYATKYAALAQLSRVYLMQGEYVKANEAVNEVIDSKSYSIIKPFSSLFYTFLRNGGANPQEYIFSMIVTQQDGVNDLNTYFGETIDEITGTSGRGDIRVLPRHLNLYEDADTRGDFFLSTNNVYTQKHLDTYGNVLQFRLAEMYLTRAECNFRLGTTTGATPVQDINVIRSRAGLPAATTVTLASIQKERHLELAFEGHTLHDARRNKENIGSLPYNSPKLIIPIPQREIDANNKLVQNEGYN